VERAKPAAKILVVDDNAQNRALVEATLEDEGYGAISCSGGESALAAFQTQRPDLVLLDVNMPGMDGHEVCRKIRQLPAGAETPILFLTAQRDVNTLDLALEAGGDDFLTKPVQPAELVLRIRAALELRRTTAELREHYELVRRQRTDMTRLQLQKEQLTGFVVHDLKNPVNTLDLHAQVLLRDKSLSEKARESVLHIRDEARVLARLISNLLDISKGEAGELTLQCAELELAGLVEEVVAAFELRAQTKRVRLEARVTPVLAHVDRDAMRRVLENLVENAIRHTPEETRVEVTVVRDGAHALIRVTDSGAGIPPEVRAKVFDRYFQVESGRAGTRGGQGLGLAFVKLAVEAHGGSIELGDAAPGAVFSIRVPHAE
jgi:signal transduction histidine kinase